MQINPQRVIDQGIVTTCDHTKVQQVGIDLSLEDTVVLEHGHSKNVYLNETIKLPKDMYAQFFQRSTYSRQGVFITTGIYDPGYKGTLGCTIYNLSGGPITIDIGERIGQLICYQADPASSYNGQWQHK